MGIRSRPRRESNSRTYQKRYGDVSRLLQPQAVPRGREELHGGDNDTAGEGTVT